MSVPPSPSTATCPEHRRALLGAAASYIYFRLQAARVRVKRVWVHGDTLDAVQVLFCYPLEWKTFLTPGAVDAGQVSTEVLRQLADLVRNQRATT